MRKAKGQAWSIDLVIGVLIFLIAVGAIYSILSSRQHEDPAPLRIESEVIATILTNNASNQLLQVAEGNQLEMDKLGGLATRANNDYELLKQELGIQNEFCIYLQDEEGNLIYITGTDGKKYAGIGPGDPSLNLTENQLPCGTPCTLSGGACVRT